MEFKLLLKKLNGSLSDKEQQIFDEWYKASYRHRTYFKRVQKNYYKEVDLIDAEKAYQKLTRKMHQRAKRPVWSYAAAVIILLLGFSVLFLTDQNILSDTPPDKSMQISAKIIALPGTDKAVLTLENGQKIALEKGKNIHLSGRRVQGGQLVYDKGMKAKAVKWNYITIPRGGKFHLKLSDGTQVQLNAESQLKYPVQFLQGQARRVELIYGEAFFEAASAQQNGGMPFKVSTSMQQVEVLGTKFNIKAYKDESFIATTLLEGKVAITDGINKQILKPNEQAYYDKETQTMTITQVNVYDVLAWIKGMFRFNNESLADLAKVLSRWYNIDIVIENEPLKAVRFNGVLSKNQNLKEILNAINKTCPILYSKEGQKVILRQ